MGFFDKFLNAIKLNDDYDDDDDFFDEEEEIEEEKPKKRFFKKMEDDIDDLDDLDEPVKKEKAPKKAAASKTSKTTKQPAREAEKVSQPKTKASSKITPLRAGHTAVANMEVCVIKPKDMEDTREISDTLLDGCTVILNLEGIDVEVAQRVIDFSSGTCYAIDGRLQKVSSYIFIMTPANVEISGDFQQIINNNFDMPAIRKGF